MLFYCSLHPDWDCFGTFRDKGHDISDLIETIASNHERKTGTCFDMLEHMGVIFGNGGFIAILLQRDPEEQILPLDTAWYQTVTETALNHLNSPIWYGLSMGGKSYMLLCYPRLTEESSRTAAAYQDAVYAAVQIQKTLENHWPHLRIIVSDMQFGELGIFRTFNNLSHALEYFDFRTAQASPVFLNSEQQLHGALISNLSAYRGLSVQIGEQLSRTDFSADSAANQICDILMESSVPSMESVHYRIQLFMLTLTDYLGSSGLVDAAYMQHKQIVYRSMAFERESELRANLATLLEELHRQYRTLQTIGRQKRIQAIRDYVEAHITDPLLSVGKITERFQISSTQLAKQFRYYYGLSLLRFIQQTRFQQAELLIREHPDWSIRDIASKAGYSDLATMYRAFHSFGDVTPGALRDSLRHSIST